MLQVAYSVMYGRNLDVELKNQDYINLVNSVVVTQKITCYIPCHSDRFSQL